MPFDVLSRRDALAELGIVPITREALDQHKLRQLRRFGGRWYTVHPRTADEVQPSLRRYGAPRKVRRLVQRVSEVHPAATWRIGWHYRDPYVTVQIDDTEQCLAIWLHRFWTVAIAEHPAERRRWWR